MSLSLQNDAKVTLTLTASDQLGRTVSLPAVPSWVSSDPGIATIDAGADPTGASAVLTSQKNGGCLINVTCGALSGSLAVSVVDPVATSLDIAPGQPSAKS